MKLKPTICPYCGYNLSLVETLCIKENKTYHCSRCKKESQVSLDEKIKLLITLFIAVSMGILIIFSVIVKKYLLGAVLLMLVSVMFYVLVPIFIDLKITR